MPSGARVVAVEPVAGMRARLEALALDAEVHEVKDHSLATLRRQLAETRERLGEHLDLYQIHSATRESGVLEDASVIDELARLREAGVHIGLSLSGPAQADTLRRALEVERDGRRLFSAVQATWNLLERSAGEALAEAHASGMGVIVKEALATDGVWFGPVAMQPGKPQGYGRVGEDRIPILTLPGNPVSSYISFEVFVLPALRKLRRAGVNADDWLLAAARRRLSQTQRSDGGWPSDDGPAFDVHTTLTAIRACR